MAVIDGIFGPGTPGGTKLTVNNGAASAAQTVGARDSIIMITGTGPWHMRWGHDGTVTSTAADFKFPSGAVMVMASGPYQTFAVFNDSGSAIDVYWMPLSR